MNPLHRFPELKKNNFKNQNENFHFCKVTNITNVKIVNVFGMTSINSGKLFIYN